MKNKSMQYRVFMMILVLVPGGILIGSIANPAKAKDTLNNILSCHVNLKCYEERSSKVNKYGQTVDVVKQSDESGKVVMQLEKLNGNLDFEKIYKDLGATKQSETDTKIVYMFPSGNIGVLVRVKASGDGKLLLMPDPDSSTLSSAEEAEIANIAFGTPFDKKQHRPIVIYDMNGVLTQQFFKEQVPKSPVVKEVTNGKVYKGEDGFFYRYELDKGTTYKVYDDQTNEYLITVQL